MENSNNQQEAPVIYWRIDEWFPDLSPEVKSRLKTYHEMLIKSNRTLNLISAKTVFVADAIHFADSISASKIITKAHPQISRIFDFGSGNGFPGLVFACMNPAVQTVLVETDNKKCEFLTQVATTLNLKNVVVLNKGIESLDENSVDFAFCRGFSSIAKTILAARKCMKKGALLFHLKGEEWGIEVGEIPSQLCSIWSPSLVGEYKLPVGAMKFSVIKTEKIA